MRFNSEKIRLISSSSILNPRREEGSESSRFTFERNESRLVEMFFNAQAFLTIVLLLRMETASDPSSSISSDHPSVLARSANLTRQYETIAGRVERWDGHAHGQPSKGFLSLQVPLILFEEAICTESVLNEHQ